MGAQAGPPDTLNGANELKNAEIPRSRGLDAGLDMHTNSPELWHIIYYFIKTQPF